MAQVQQKERVPNRHSLFSFQIKIFLLIVQLNFPCLADKGNPLQVLQENKSAIREAAKLFHLSPRLIASVIYVEHAENVSWMDRDIDPLLAEYGLNVSLGLGQVKINTAQWIEKALHDSTSKYFPGARYSELIPLSVSREEVVKRLFNPSWNAKYIAAFFIMIQHRWKNANVNIDGQVDILATLYSAGVVEDKDEKRSPHRDPVSNRFGKLAKIFYEAHHAEDEFPKEMTSIIN